MSFLFQESMTLTRSICFSYVLLLLLLLFIFVYFFENIHVLSLRRELKLFMTIYEINWLKKENNEVVYPLCCVRDTA